MQEEIERMLPLIRTGKISPEDIKLTTEKLRQTIKDDPGNGKKLGELFGKIKQAVLYQAIATDVNWVEVQQGFLAIGHKPGGKISLEGLQKEGTAAVVTLLNENEGAALIGKQATKFDIEWIWFPFSASKPHQGTELNLVYDLYFRLSGLLNEGKKVYIHCSAGIHRTGMITYGLLIYLGKEKVEALQLLQSLRKVTAAQVGEDRLLWGDQFDKPHQRQYSRDI
jgi:protein-tyrosine phosphatase